ncbi:hypothetical protein C8034_v009454 [Colletotrichum sidae]|uniref:Uncharacterized protein n=1 Tax=Colletotrichum sidae TaxID=1347389 RepID=A0A4R8TKF5_9PEZI|nr:hypothetical protein C8034_v009454 [Colletotrichum sidae]
MAATTWPAGASDKEREKWHFKSQGRNNLLEGADERPVACKSPEPTASTLREGQRNPWFSRAGCVDQHVAYPGSGFIAVGTEQIPTTRRHTHKHGSGPLVESNQVGNGGCFQLQTARRFANFASSPWSSAVDVSALEAHCRMAPACPQNSPESHVRRTGGGYPPGTVAVLLAVRDPLERKVESSSDDRRLTEICAGWQGVTGVCEDAYPCGKRVPEGDALGRDVANKHR